jgi:hypothetical protein
MEVPSISQLLSSVTRTYTNDRGYTVNTVTYKEVNGVVTSTQERFTVYNKQGDVEVHTSKHTVDTYA